MEHQKHHANYALAELELSATSQMSRRLFGDKVHLSHKSASTGADNATRLPLGQPYHIHFVKFLKCPL